MSNKDLQWLKLCSKAADIFSTCAKRKYAAFIVDSHGHVVGMGYNGVPKGMTHCSNGGCPRLKEESLSGSPYDNCFSIHAEANALLHSDYAPRREGATLYVNGQPCFSCAKLIVNGVDRVVFISDPTYSDSVNTYELLVESRVQFVPYNLEDLEDVIRGVDF